MSQQAERETLEVDVLIVGGGPAGMSAALRLAQLQKQHGGEPLAIAVLEKAREVGAHLLSGAVLDPRALRDLVPDFQQRGLGKALLTECFRRLQAAGMACVYIGAAPEPYKANRLYEAMRPVARYQTNRWVKPLR